VIVEIVVSEITAETDTISPKRYGPVSIVAAILLAIEQGRVLEMNEYIL
jgi:hypothetical protein